MKAWMILTRFQDRLQKHLERWGRSTGHPIVPKWVYWKHGIYKDHRKLADAMVRNGSVKPHDQIHHLRSSQVFAFNLFLPFQKGTRMELSKRMSALVGVQLTIDDVRLEWAPPLELLGEPGGVGATAADVALWGRLENGGRAVVLVEVKLSEKGFSPCKGRTSDRNDRPEVCASAKRFLNEPSACYLIRSARARRTGHYRRYWEIFAECDDGIRNAFPNVDLSGPCPFAYDMQQPMRNLAIARGLEQKGTVEKAWFVLCAHDDNPDIAAHWGKWQKLLPDPALAPFLPASEVVRIGEAEGLTEWAAYMRDRYLLKEAHEGTTASGEPDASLGQRSL